LVLLFVGYAARRAVFAGASGGAVALVEVVHDGLSIGRRWVFGIAARGAALFVAAATFGIVVEMRATALVMRSRRLADFLVLAAR
jgi:hypothetical protein